MLRWYSIKMYLKYHRVFSLHLVEKFFNFSDESKFVKLVIVQTS
jgi:hypothetical protein